MCSKLGASVPTYAAQFRRSPSFGSGAKTTRAGKLLTFARHTEGKLFVSHNRSPDINVGGHARKSTWTQCFDGDGFLVHYISAHVYLYKYTNNITGIQIQSELFGINLTRVPFEGWIQEK